MKPYPKYKDSGIEWLGEIPAGWEVKPLKTQTDFINGAAFKPEKWTDEGTPIIRIENLNGGDNFNYYAEEVDHRYHVYNGDLLFGWSGNRGTSFGPFIWTRDGRYFLNQHIFNLKKIKAHEMWFYWMLKAVTKTIEEEAHGIIGMVHVTKGMLGGMKIPLPPLPEQQSIANFLDQKTTKIDELVMKNERVIELLKEKRQAIISHAVTKGLDPNAKMKDSGIEWIGKIPEGWEVKRLKYVCMINPPKSQYKGSKNIEVTFLPMEKVGEQGEINKNETRNFKDVCNGYTYFENSDVLVAKITPCFENGKGCFVQGLSNGIGFGSTEFHVLRANKKVMPEYLYLVTYSYPFRKMGEIMLIGAAGQKRVPEDFVKNFSIGIPPLTEQIQILNKLKRELQQIELIITKIQSQIENLKEYRQALISNVVTGKVSVL